MKSSNWSGVAVGAGRIWRPRRRCCSSTSPDPSPAPARGQRHGRAEHHRPWLNSCHMVRRAVTWAAWPRSCGRPRGRGQEALCAKTSGRPDFGGRTSGRAGSARHGPAAAQAIWRQPGQPAAAARIAVRQCRGGSKSGPGMTPSAFAAPARYWQAAGPISAGTGGKACYGLAAARSLHLAGRWAWCGQGGHVELFGNGPLTDIPERACRPAVSVPTSRPPAAGS